ncbi:hypothetical protein HIM_08849 [Hirsutella minnesotensis 3608]|uniref:DUF6570 domain-containing protein n=1 Tax=Hirsutella minnesotensis 3608 TaxID=1043627 RepID=A0A0F8A3G0_9HYPO|nr:hypothetical protein HIM_08849 [Hirsutella minnesotensis 3608]
MADSIPSTNICRKCKQEKPEDQFISKTKSSITRGRRTANCLDCRNRQASGTSKRTAEQAELSPIRRQGLPLLDLQLGTPIISQGPILLGTPLAMSTGADAPAPITSRPGPSVPSQEGVRLGAPIESPVSSPSIWPRHARGRYSRPSVQQSVIERRDFQLPDPDWMGDLSNCPLSDRDKELLEKFWTELENDRMERCTRCQETWFDMGLKDDICKRCIAKDKNKKEDEPWFFSAENQLDFGLIPVFLPELTKVEEMLIAPVHVFVNVMQVRGQQYKYRGHIVHFLRDVGKVYRQLPLEFNNMKVALVLSTTLVSLGVAIPQIVEPNHFLEKRSTTPLGTASDAKTLGQTWNGGSEHAQNRPLTPGRKGGTTGPGPATPGQGQCKGDQCKDGKCKCHCTNPPGSTHVGNCVNGGTPTAHCDEWLR